MSDLIPCAVCGTPVLRRRPLTAAERAMPSSASIAFDPDGWTWDELPAFGAVLVPLNDDTRQEAYCRAYVWRDQHEPARISLHHVQPG